MQASLGKITHKQGESITTLTDINDSQVKYARDAHVQLGLDVKEIIAQGEKTHKLYNQLEAKTNSMEVDIVNLKEASEQTAGLPHELKGISEQTAGLQHSLKDITDKHTSYDTTNLDFRLRIQELTQAQEVLRAKLIQITNIVFKDIKDIT